MFLFVATFAGKQLVANDGGLPFEHKRVWKRLKPCSFARRKISVLIRMDEIGVK